MEIVFGHRDLRLLLLWNIVLFLVFACVKSVPVAYAELSFAVNVDRLRKGWEEFLDIITSSSVGIGPIKSDTAASPLKRL